jgi:hypothetical protein
MKDIYLQVTLLIGTIMFDANYQDILKYEQFQISHEVTYTYLNKQILN